MIEIAGLIAAAALLATLITLEVRSAGTDTVQPPRPRLLSRTLSRSVVAIMWTMYLLLFLPRLLGLLT